jgi:large subunit ribosomal protein L19
MVGPEVVRRTANSAGLLPTVDAEGQVWYPARPDFPDPLKGLFFIKVSTMHAAALQFIEDRQIRKNAPDFRTGDTVCVNWKIKEGDKERVQAFEGIVIRKTKGANRATFTVRKMSFGVGVERIFPLHSPRYESIDVKSRGDVARNRLFYLRGLRGKASKVDQLEDRDEAAAPSAPVPAK